MPRATYKKVITSDELTAQINPQNLKLMERFLREKDTRCSDGTVKGYRSDLMIFFTWVLQNCDNKFFVQLKKIEFAEFFSYAVKELKWSSARFARMRSSLSSLSDYVEKFFDDEYPTFRNVILKAIESMPKEPVREKTILSDEQIEHLLAFLVENQMHQEACWLALAAASGSRFTELLRFTTDIIDVNHTAFEGLFLETLKKIKSKGRTKSGKMLTKYILREMFLPYYERWITERAKIMEKYGKTHTSLFIDSTGDPAEPHHVRVWTEHFEKILGVPFYPHSLRHFYTTLLSRTGIPNQLVQELVGWSSAGMVEIYNDLAIKDRVWSELNNLKERFENRE